MKTFKAHEQRVIDELNELAVRIAKLDAFIATSDIFTALDDMQRGLLETQLHHMQEYKNTLEARVTFFEATEIPAEFTGIVTGNGAMFGERVMYHLVVGNKNLQASDDDLKKVVKEFQEKELPAFKISTSVHTYPINDCETMILNAGDKDWQPTEDELQALVTTFKNARLDPKGSVVATRYGVSINIIPKPAWSKL